MSHNNNKDGPNNRQSSFMDKVVLWNFRYFWLCPWRRWVAVGHEIITPLALLQTKDSPSAKREEWSHSIEGLILAKTSKISRKFHSWKMNFFSNHVRGPRDQKMTKMMLRCGSPPHVRPLITRWKLNSLNIFCKISTLYQMHVIIFKCVFLQIISIKVSPFRIGKRNRKSTFFIKYAESWSFLLW